MTVSLDVGTLRKARALAAREGLSISAMVCRQIGRLVAEDELYERSQRAALALLETGFPMGGKITASRDEWHERR